MRLTAEFPGGASGLLEYSNCSDSVLMYGLQLRIILSLSLQVHLSEHIQSRFLPGSTHAGPTFRLHRPDYLPSAFVSLKPIRFAILKIISCAGSEPTRVPIRSRQQSSHLHHSRSSLRRVEVVY